MLFDDFEPRTFGKWIDYISELEASRMNLSLRKLQ